MAKILFESFVLMKTQSHLTSSSTYRENGIQKKHTERERGDNKKGNGEDLAFTFARSDDGDPFMADMLRIKSLHNFPHTSVTGLLGKC